MFFRASIALSGAFLRLKRQELSKVTQLFPRRKRLLLRGLRPRHGCAPRSDRFLSDQRFSSALLPLFPFLLRSRFVPAATDTPPSSASRLSRPRLSCPPSPFRAHFLLPLSCRRASFQEFSPDVTTRRSLPGVILLPARPVHTAFSPWPPHESSFSKQKMPSGSAFPRRLVFPSLPCVCVPRPPSPAPHLLCIPRRKRRQHRHAFVPQHLHTQKARLHDADGPLHCKKAPIRNQACIPG